MKSHEKLHNVLKTGEPTANQWKIFTPPSSPLVAAEFVSPYDTYVQTQRGVQANTIGQIQKRLGVTLKELAGLLRISESTIHKYKQPSERITDQGMAEQLILLGSLAEHGQSIFKKRDGFQQWLRSPQWDLNDVPPLAFLSTGQGIVFVNEILSRIEHGLPA